METKQEFFRPSSFELLAEAEADYWWFRSRNRILLWVLKKHVGKFEKFLEIGCGTAFVLKAISKAYPNAELYGSEYFQEGLKHAKRRVPTANFSQNDARNMRDVEDYDVIGAFDVIEHIAEDELVLSNLSRALKYGGTLLVTVPQHRWLWSTADEYACHVRRYTRPELINKVEQAGLKVDFVTSFVCLLLPLMWLSRARACDSNYDHMSEFAISSWANRVLEIIMTFELWLLKIGLKLPFGGSLLLLGRKK